MISAKTIRGATTYSILGHPDRGGMLTSAVLRRSRMFGEREGCDSISLHFDPKSPVSMTMAGGPDGRSVGPDRYAASWDYWHATYAHSVTTYERFGARRAELLALARDLEAARDLLTNEDLGPWVERFADIMDGVEP